jgi:hypothetical protein
MRAAQIIVLLAVLAGNALAGVKEDLYRPTRTDSLLWQINKRAILYTENYRDPVLAGALGLAFPGAGAWYSDHNILDMFFFIAMEWYGIYRLWDGDEIQGTMTIVFTHIGGAVYGYNAAIKNNIKLKHQLHFPNF